MKSSTAHLLRTFPFIPAAFLLTGCIFGKCPEDQYIGTLDLEEESLQMFPDHYPSLQTIKFSNGSGAEQEYRGEYHEDYFLLPWEVIEQCDVEPYEDVLSYYDVQQIRTELLLTENSWMSVQMEVRRSGQDQVLQDILQATFVREYAPLAEITLVSSFRDALLESKEVEEYDTLYSTLTIRDRDFVNVYESEGYGTISLLFTIEDGIIGYEEDGEIWLVDE